MMFVSTTTTTTTTTEAKEATMFDPTTTVELPADGSPFGVGPKFEIVVRTDITTHHGNVSVKAGRYEAQQSDDAPEGVVSVWSPEYYAKGDRDGGWVSIAAHMWTFPGEMSRPVPAHDCADHARSGVVSGVYCGVCGTVMA